jgi:hypothetical protein
METPALILWSEGPFEKWHSRGKKHVFVRLEPPETTIPLERVWTALEPMLGAKSKNLEKTWDSLVELPPPSDSVP